MRVGIPREIKTLESRVALVPEAAGELVQHGHEVLVERGAGALSGYEDGAYRDLGVRVVQDAATLYGEAEVIVKVKEPQPAEYPLLRADHLLFCYLHLAAEPDLFHALLDIGLTAVAFETVSEGTHLPLLAPMSDIAGRLSIQVGAHLLHRPQGGKGLLLGGLPSGERGHVVVIGAGVAGGGAVHTAAGLGAQVTVFDKNPEKLAVMHEVGPNVTALYPYSGAVHRAVAEADILVGAVLVPGARAPRVVDRAMVASMQPGSVVVDISVDQGGCVETTRPTTYAAPTYLEEGVVHFAVTNMPGAVPRTASQALSAALIPYTLKLLQPDWRSRAALAAGINVQGGEIVYPALRNMLATPT